jgi:hypothetical protein
LKNVFRVALFVAMLAPLVVSGQTVTVAVRYSWTAPVDGSAVHHYEIQTSAADPVSWSAAGTVTTPAATLGLAANVATIVRVRGVDALGRSGLWSDNSEPYTADPGPPGACGKPARQL